MADAHINAERGTGTVIATTASGAVIDTAVSGDHRFVVSATDPAGHTTLVEHHYRVE